VGVMKTAALAVLLVAAAAGCGGSDDDAPSREDFAGSANRICREAEAKVNEIAEQTRARPGLDPDEAAIEVLERGTEAYRPYMDRLRDLAAPEDLRDDWDAFLDGVQEAFDLFPRLAAATRSRDREELSELTTRFAQIAGDTRPFAQEHGLTDCLPEN
jgi:hypothetical protein